MAPSAESGPIHEADRVFPRDADVGGAEEIPLKRYEPDDRINAELATHAAAADWAFADHSAILHSWAVTINERLLDGVLPTPALSFEQERGGVLGTYRIGRDGLGLRFRVNLPPTTLRRPLATVIAVLCHELVHGWEESVLGRRRGGRYHTVAFRKKAREIGIPTCAAGIYAGIAAESPIARLLAEQGVQPDQYLTSAAEPQRQTRSGSRLVRWKCLCTRVWASAGVSVDARCVRCGTSFTR